MIIGNIKDVLLSNRDNLIVMFIIKNSEGKYLITSNPYFNYYSLPCKYIQLTELEDNTKRDEAESIISTFLKQEFDFSGLITKYLEGLKCVANINGELKRCNLICFEIKTDNDIKEALNKKVPFSPTESYKFKQFYNFDDINTYSWNRLIDNNSLYFIYRSLDETEVPEVNVELNLNLELGD